MCISHPTREKDADWSTVQGGEENPGSLLFDIIKLVEKPLSPKVTLMIVVELWKPDDDASFRVDVTCEKSMRRC